VAVYLPGFPENEEFEFTCTTAYLVNLGTGGVASLSLAFSIFMIVAYCRRVRRYRDFRQVFNHDDTEPLLPPQPSTSNSKRWTSERSATPSATPLASPSAPPSATPSATPSSAAPVKTNIIKKKPTSSKLPETKAKTNVEPTHSQPSVSRTNQNATNVSPTNPLPSCSTSTYQAPLPAKKQKKSWLSNLFSKKTDVDELRPANVDVTVNIVKESKNTKQKAKKSKKITVPIDNKVEVGEHRVTLEDCPNCPEDSEDENELARPPNENKPG